MANKRIKKKLSKQETIEKSENRLVKQKKRHGRKAHLSSKQKKAVRKMLQAAHKPQARKKAVKTFKRNAKNGVHKAQAKLRKRMGMSKKKK